MPETKLARQQPSGEDYTWLARASLYSSRSRRHSYGNVGVLPEAAVPGSPTRRAPRRVRLGGLTTSHRAVFGRSKGSVDPGGGGTAARPYRVARPAASRPRGCKAADRSAASSAPLGARKGSIGFVSRRDTPARVHRGTRWCRPDASAGGGEPACSSGRGAVIGSGGVRSVREGTRPGSNSGL